MAILHSIISVAGNIVGAYPLFITINSNYSIRYSYQIQMESASHHSVPSTPNRSPIASRPYLQMSQSFYNHSHQSQPQTPHLMQQTSSVISEPRGVIYGTTIDTNQVLLNLQRFIREFETMIQVTVGNQKEIIPKKIYMEELKLMVLSEEKTVLTVSGSHIKEFDREMYYQFIYFPAQMISCFDLTIKNVFYKLCTAFEQDQRQLQKQNEKKEKLMVGIQSLDEISILRNLTHNEINKLVSFKGIVIRCSDIQPEMKAAAFSCCNCRFSVQVVLENAKVQQPKQCEKCKGKQTMELVHNMSIFTDKQFIKFQELPQFVPEGQTPQAITILAYDNNVDTIKPGDRVEIVGIYRAQPLRVQKSRRAIRSVFNTYVDLISSKVLQDNTYKVSDKSQQEFDDEERKSFFQNAKSPDIIDRLVNSFAPSIFGNEEVKKGILALLFGGSQKKFSQSGSGRFRSDINICLVGDPSTAKSQLLQQVHKIAPRGIYTSGRGSSAVGLTANVRRDPETKEFILESGALVMSDMGVCCIDQFDKMDDNNKTILLEVMEQQTISVAKAGIVCSLKSRTSILAAANPVNSKYNPKKSVVENINLPPSLLSRFDLIYIMLDRAVESYDIKLAHHILNIYSSKKKEELHQGVFPRHFLTNYITFAKLYIHPQLTEPAINRLSQAYVSMRSLGINKKIISATPRQLESLIRLSQAMAKMRLSQTVEITDVEEAINLMRIATQQSATDPTTGCIDMDVLMTGRTNSFRARINQICEKLKDHIKSNVSKYRKGVNFDFVLEQVQMLLGDTDQKVIEVELREAFKVLASEEVIITYGPNKNKPSVKLCKDLFSDK